MQPVRLLAREALRILDLFFHKQPIRLLATDSKL